MEESGDLTYNGQRLGSMTTRRLEWLIENCDDDEIRDAAAEVVAYRKDHYSDRDE